MKNDFENQGNFDIAQNDSEAEESVSEKSPGFAKSEMITFADNKCVDFLKVHHTEQTLKNFSTEIEEQIDRSDILVSEMAVFEDAEDKAGMEIFYNGITRIAEEKGKIMVVADPEKKLSDAIVNRAIDIAPMLASIGTGAYLAKKLSDISFDLQQQKYNRKYERDNKEQFQTTRRDVLKGIAATVATVAGGLHGIAGALDEIGITTKEDGLLETFLLSSLDYRNALVAKEIIRLSDQHENISVIYGAAHFPGIKKFLENPNLLEEKIERYEKTYGLIYDDEPEVYDFRADIKL